MTIADLNTTGHAVRLDESDEPEHSANCRMWTAFHEAGAFIFGDLIELMGRKNLTFKRTEDGHWLVPNYGVFASLEDAMEYLTAHIDALPFGTIQVRIY